MRSSLVGVRNGERKACCTRKRRPAWAAQKSTVSKGESQTFKSIKALCWIFTQQNKNKRITNVQNKLMRLLKVAFPSYQQAGHQNQTTDTFHTLSFIWAFQGTTLCNDDWTAKIHGGIMFQIMLSVLMGMWNLIYRSEERVSGLKSVLNPAWSGPSCFYCFITTSSSQLWS